MLTHRVVISNRLVSVSIRGGLASSRRVNVSTCRVVVSVELQCYFAKPSCRLVESSSRVVE